MADTPWALQVRGLKKSYGSAVALAGADFELGQCEIHALLGENGAGKSTLIKVLAGLLRPDEGEIRVSGRDWPTVATPRDAALFGLRFVHQDLGLVDAMSVLDNVAIETGYVTRKGGLIDFPATSRAVSERLRALGSDIDPCRLVGDLSQAEKVITAIARALAGQARIIVLDEVTASLPAPVATRLHGVIRRTREQGVSVVFVTHRIEEIFGLCDRATVFADGCRVASAALDQVDHAQIVRWIVGRDVQHRAKPVVSMARAACVQLRGLLGKGLGSPLDFEVGCGEVLGITGLVGSGYEAAAHWLAGVGKPEAGSFMLDGQVLPLGDAGALRVHGYQVISGERAASVFPGLTVRENIFALAKHGRAGSISAERRRCAELIRRFGIQPAECGELEIGMLSGGNQQKVLFARALESTPRALLMIDPTAGVDIGARAELYDLLRRETARGMAVILASSDFEEIESLADRALVLANGSPVALLEGAALTQSRLVYEALKPVDAQRTSAQADDKEIPR